MSHQAMKGQGRNLHAYYKVKDASLKTLHPFYESSTQFQLDDL